jgi:hypothetical protein
MTEVNATTNAEQPPLDAKTEDGHVDLPSGEPFGADSLGDVLRQVPGRLIVIGGTQKSGKTTLIASIYERYRGGRFADMIFAGSRTLPGLERICHLGRQQSGRMTPETDRTSLSLGWQVFHLAVADRQRRWDFLLADMSGEAYEHVRDFGGANNEMALLGRADHFALLLDGAKLSDVRERQIAYDDSDTILRRLVESRQLSPETPVTVVFSKWDIVERADGEAKEYCDAIQARMHERFGPRLKELRFRSVIARDDRANGQPATHGVAELLKSWREEAILTARDSSPAPTMRRWIDKYGCAGNR